MRTPFNFQLSTHHAFLIQGEPVSADEVYVTFDIADAHELHRRASLAVADGDVQTFSIGAYGFGREAQNALLKTLEEPMPGTKFVIITPYPDDLLPTLRSRLHILEDLEAKLPSEEVFDAEKFLRKTPIERLKYLEKTFFDVRDESDEVHARTKYDAGAILSALEIYYAKNPELAKKDKTAFELLEKSKQYIHDTAPAIKLILESLALHLPRLVGGQAV
ncbi:MAG: hypothetical protein WC764_04050 [Candidatus Paceibacterota bacterium]|jgi:DNA polymerase III delta prime subunit